MATPPDFTAGAVLTAAQMNQIGLFLVKTEIVGTGVASVVVDEAFSDEYENYRIVYSGGSSNTLASLTMNLGASVTGYYSIVNYALYSATTVPLSAGDNNGATWVYMGYASPNHSSASFDVLGPYLEKFTAYSAAGWSAITVAGTSSGVHQVAASYDSFTLAPNAGTLSGGTIRVYGYKN